MFVGLRHAFVFVMNPFDVYHCILLVLVIILAVINAFPDKL
jgi:hypothetical protein